MAKNSRDQIRINQMKVLAELQKNSDENIDTIAKHCGISKQKVSKIIKQLKENHLIWGYTVVGDELKQGLQKFILLIQRSMQKIDDEIMKQLISYRTDKDISKLGVTVENSYFVHGEYDWVLIFTAQDILHAQKFSDALTNKYPGMVSKTNIIQVLMTLRSQHILNPDYMKLKELI